MKTNRDSFFTKLPTDIRIEILSRLPIRTIMKCRRVSKSWRELLETLDFATIHVSRSTSATCLTLIEDKPFKFGVFLDDEHPLHDCSITAKFSFLGSPSWYRIILHSSVSGLLFMLDTRPVPQLFLCNPITREYIELSRLHPHPPEAMLYLKTYGFGVSKITGQYKIVKIFSKFEGFIRPMCEVYTLGTGLWRSIGACSSGLFDYSEDGVGVFLNGNLHWLVNDSKNDRTWISCLDLETELFTSFSPPPNVDSGKYWLSALEGRLCLSDNSGAHDIDIWFMNKYGDGNSWVKELTIRKPYTPHELGGFFYPVKVFEDGDILFASAYTTEYLVFQLGELVWYSIEYETVREYGLLQGRNNNYCANVVVYTPSFVSLRSLGMENVGTF